MSIERLTRALKTAQFSLPSSGKIGFWNAPAGLPFAPDRVIASQSFLPVFDTLKAEGVHVSPTPTGDVDASIVFCHRSKPATLSLLAQACEVTRKNGLIALNGDKTEGIDSLVKTLRAELGDVEVFSKAHGKVVWFENNQEPSAQWHADWQEIERGFQTWLGIFSSDAVDTGSQILAEHLPTLSGTVVDLGAGWGYLAHSVLKSCPDVSQIDLVEADFHATEAAKRNVTDPRARVFWADVTKHQGLYDTALTNPPFHTSRKPDPKIGMSFIRAAANLLKPNGALWLVANQTLPYEQCLSDSFRITRTIATQAGFKVLYGKGPRSEKSAARNRHASSIT